MIKVLIMCVVIVLWMELPSGGDAECCYKHKYNWGLGFKKRCGDCKQRFAALYCGVGSCNVFGCNCDGGCRTGACTGEQYHTLFGKRGAVSADKMADARDVIRGADSDGDGRKSVEEAQGHLGARHGDVTRALAAMDANNDRFLDAREIDA